MTPNRLEEGLQFVARYASKVEEWTVVKKELLKFFTPEERKNFSTRDPLTKAQSLNDFEKKLIERWLQITGVGLILKK